MPIALYNVVIIEVNFCEKSFVEKKIFIKEEYKFSNLKVINFHGLVCLLKLVHDRGWKVCLTSLLR